LGQLGLNLHRPTAAATAATAVLAWAPPTINTSNGGSISNTFILTDTPTWKGLV